MMEVRRRRPFHDEDAMAAMNDIMFFLMLFFLIIATMSNANIIKILLPKSDTTERMAKQPLTLTVTEDLRYYVNSNEVPANLLESALKQAVARNQDPTVVLRIAKSLTVQDLVDVMSRAIDSGRFDVLLCRYSFLDYPEQQSLIDRAHAAGVGFVAMKTLAGAKGADLERFKARNVTYKQAALKWVLANERLSNLVISISSLRRWARAARITMPLVLSMLHVAGA